MTNNKKTEGKTSTLCEGVTETQKLNQLIGTILESQKQTAPVELSIGYTSEDNQVQHDCIVIKDCPGTTLEVINRFPGVRTCMVKGGLLVEFW